MDGCPRRRVRADLISIGLLAILVGLLNATLQFPQMIRQTTDASSAFAMMVVSAASDAAFQYVTTAGGSAASVAGTAAAAPQWVRIARAGNTISGYQSSDGVSWQRVGIVTIAMEASTEVGLVVSSHANTTLSKATFDHVRP